MRRHAKGLSAHSFEGSGAADGARISAAVLLVLVLVLVLAPTANAAKGVVGYFGNPTTATGTTGGLFSTTSGVGGTAVNFTTGDVYVVVANRLRVAEERLGHPVSARRVELETALRLRRCLGRESS